MKKHNTPTEKEQLMEKTRAELAAMCGKRKIEFKKKATKTEFAALIINHEKEKATKVSRKEIDMTASSARAGADPSKDGERFYFEPTGHDDEWQVRLGDKRIGRMIKESGKYRPKGDRLKDKILFDTKEQCANQLVKINEAKSIYRSWRRGWRGLSEREQKKWKWVKELFRYM